MRNLENVLKFIDDPQDEKFDGKMSKIMDTVSGEIYEMIGYGISANFYKPAILDKIYGRKNLGLRVYARKPKNWQEYTGEDTWTEEEINNIAKIQNIFSFGDLAPRVYDVVKLDGGIYGHVVECLDGQRGFSEKGTRDKAIEIIEEFLKTKDLAPKGIIKMADFKNDDFIQGKITDCNDFVKWDIKSYEEKIIEKLKKSQWIGTGGYQCYQSFEGINGKRNTQYRSQMLKLDEDDFNDKIVLDIGCSVGAFCHEAARRGAKRIIGIDAKEVIPLAREFANLKGYYNIDFYSMELQRYSDIVYNEVKERIGLEKFDITFLLSMERWVGLKNCQWIFDSCNEIIYCEEHPGVNIMELPDRFRMVELGKLNNLGTEDLNRRIFKGYVK